MEVIIIINVSSNFPLLRIARPRERPSILGICMSIMAIWKGHPVSVDKKFFVIGFDPEFSDELSLIDNSHNHTLIQTKLSELGHPNLHVKFVKAEAPLGAPRK